MGANYIRMNLRLLILTKLNQIETVPKLVCKLSLCQNRFRVGRKAELRHALLLFISKTQLGQYRCDLDRFQHICYGFCSASAVKGIRIRFLQRDLW
jgi:hypothetical protein